MSEETGAVESTVDTGQTETTISPETGAPETALEAAVRKFKVKIDGAEQEVDEAELLRGYQTTTAAQKKFNEAAMMRKQAEELLNLAKTNPRKMLEHPAIGANMQQLIEEYIAEKLEEDSLSAEERELRDVKRRLQAYEEERQAAEERAKQEQLEKYTQVYEQQLSEGIVSALETSGLPKTEATVRNMAQYMMTAYENGLNVSPADVVEFVKKDYINQITALFGAANEDTLLALLGDQVTNKVVKGHMKKAQSSIKPAEQKVTTLTQPVKRGSREGPTLTREELDARIRERLGNR